MTVIFAAVFPFHSRAEGETKAQLVDQYVEARWPGKSNENLIRDMVLLIVGCGPYRFNMEKMTAIGNHLPSSDITKVRTQAINEDFSEAEIKALLEMRKSPLGQKINATLEKITAREKVLIMDRLTGGYEKVTGEKYVSGDSQAPAEPNWATKLVWKIFPKQRKAYPADF